MCGRFSLTTEVQVLVDLFEVERVLFDAADVGPRYNMAPSQMAPVVRTGASGRELALARWGLVPRWSTEPKSKYSTINARAETVAQKPTYRDSFRHRRCLVPATGFYEWRQEGDVKVPYYVRIAGRDVFALAGVWDHWERDGQGFDSFSIIVTRANPTLQRIHDRMPVILNEAQYNTWLSSEHFNRPQLESLLLPFDGELEVYRVSRKVNNPRNDDPSLIEGA
jgi:putative SOS response-associated peptidase YedK